MLGLLKKIIAFFSPYAKPFEKKVDRFFRNLSDRSLRDRVHKKLLNLMQQDLVAVNLWMERRYKGYIYLKKKVRKNLYKNVEELVKDFEKFEQSHKINESELKKIFQEKHLSFPRENQKIIYLAKIADYLKPGKRYTYQEGANFGKLLKDPKQEILIGDCNQMVTLYAYLYSLHFPLSDLKIKLIPGHVCLHFDGIDIEATNGQFKHYKKFDYISPIQEIIAVNLLDVSDADEKTTKITPETLMQSSKFAYLTSGMKELVTRNLHSAYQNLGLELVKNKQFDDSLVYFKKLNDPSLIDHAYIQAVHYNLKNKSFTQAKRYAQASGSSELRDVVYSHQARDFYGRKKYEQALKLYKTLGDQKSITACYLAQYNELAGSVKDVKTTAQAKTKKSTYQKMRELASKGQYHEGVKQMDKLLKQI